MTRRRTLAALLALAALTGCASQRERPYVLLVSIDGFRHDYAALHGAPNLDRIAAEGVRAEALIPSFPSSTFPNHHAIATGMYPGHHGIVNNVFFDPGRRERFVYSRDGSDGSWYGGTPLWVLAEQQGVRTAAFFWPGTDGEIQGTRPSEYRRYDESVSNRERVEQVLAWFRAPEAERPHFVTLYFSDVDSAGHGFGPEAEETKQAVAAVDAEIGRLMDGLAQFSQPVNLLVISDHGMKNVVDVVNLGPEAEFDAFEIAQTRAPHLMLYADDEALVSRTITRLRARSDPRYRVYRREETPAHLFYNQGERIGDIVVIAEPGYLLQIGEPTAPPAPGAHGWDPSVTGEMGAIFYAQGPALKKGVVIPAFENVHIYPLIAHILGLDVAENIDGSLDVLRGALSEQWDSAADAR
jgi:alkaline phosphatase D